MIIHRFTDKLVDNGVFYGESSILPTIWSALAIGGKDLLGIDLLRGQCRVDLVMGHVAALLGGTDIARRSKNASLLEREIEFDRRRPAQIESTDHRHNYRQFLIRCRRQCFTRLGACSW